MGAAFLAMLIVTAFVMGVSVTYFGVARPWKLVSDQWHRDAVANLVLSAEWQGRALRAETVTLLPSTPRSMPPDAASASSFDERHDTVPATEITSRHPSAGIAPDAPKSASMSIVAIPSTQQVTAVRHLVQEPASQSSAVLSDVTSASQRRLEVEPSSAIGPAAVVDITLSTSPQAPEPLVVSKLAETEHTAAPQARSEEVAP